MYAVAVGVMGIDPESFRWMTLKELYHAYDAFFEAKNAQMRERWEMERWSVANLINIQLEPKDRVAPNEMFPFPWEKPSKRKSRQRVVQKSNAELCKIFKSEIVEG